MVMSLDIQMMPDFADMNPGENYHATTMWDEGCGEITRTQLLESTARHTVNGIHSWSEDGFKSVHEQWFGRICETRQLAPGLEESELVGLDESGNALLSGEAGTTGLTVFEALEQLRKLRKLRVVSA